MMSRDDVRPARRAVASLQRPLASGLTVAGGLLVALGVLRALLVLDVVPEAVGAAVGTWWPVLLVAVGVWSLGAGRRVTGSGLVLVGAVLLAITALPSGTRAPALLIGLGIVLVWGATGGHRWLLGDARIALFDDLRAGHRGEPAARSYVAVFGEATGRLDTSAAAEGLVECLAVFGDVEVRVPADLGITLAEVAVFGDVRPPAAPTGAVSATLPVRATSVFGDVRLVRE